eukprot:scaffold284191_cov31-Tisochrysis_lutea.AAC.1
MQDRALLLGEGWEREAQEFVETGRDWGAVRQVMRSSVLRDRPLPGDIELWLPSGLPDPPPATRSPTKKERQTWALTIAYFGPAFDSFTWQPEAPERTVMGCVQAAIEPLLCDRHGLFMATAGRTDAGVSATAQLITFYSWEPLTLHALQSAINSAAPGKLKLRAAYRVPRSFHATFSATWRRYVYLLPQKTSGPSPMIDLQCMNTMLGQLVGSAYDYAALGRGVPRGKNTTTTILHARASQVFLPGDGSDGEQTSAIRFDIVGDRFLRRQVRCLVATAILAVRKSPNNERTLIDLATSGDQRKTAPAAPGIGLCFVQAGYDSYPQ